MSGEATTTMTGADYAELGRLRAENEALKKKAKKLYQERKELAEGFEKLDGDHKKLLADIEANPLKKQLDDAKKAIRDGRHKDAFAKAAKGLNPDALEIAYRESGYAAEGDEPDPEKLDAAVKALRDSKPFLFGDAADSDPKRPAGPGPGANRGASDGSSSAFPFTREQMQDPSFMARNGNAVAKALKARNESAGATA